MRFLALLAAVLFVTPAALAQDTSGDVQGRVVDSDGKPIPTVDVIFTGTAMPGSRSASTNAQGIVWARGLPVGAYAVEFRRLGYRSVVLEAVKVRLGRTTALGSIQMVEAPVELEPLAASAAPALIDPVSTAGGVNLTPELYENLPMERDYQAMLTLVSQANESYLGDGLSVAGGTGPENRFFIDGADVTDPYFGIESTRLPYNFIREVEVKTGGYEAEYRSSLGGITNVVTYSGGNRFSGQIFGFFASDQLQGSSRLGPAELTKTDVATVDFGGTLGGPIVRDRLWFFGAYNPYFHSETVEPTGQGPYEDRTVQHRFAGKLTWRLASRTDVSFTAFGDPGSRDAVAPITIPGASLTLENPDPWLTERAFGGTNLVLAASQLLGGGGQLEGSFSYSTRRDRVQPATERGFDLLFQDMQNSTMSGGVVDRSDASMWRAAVWLKTTWDVGRHTIKGGVEYYENYYEASEDDRNFVRMLNDSTFVEFLIQIPGEARTRIPAAFVQDSWRVGERFRLNVGLRWEDQRLYGSSDEVAQAFRDQVQPRVGFVWQLGRPGSQRLFGSAGRFYQDIALNVANGYYNDGQVWQITGFDHDPRDDPSGGETLFGYSSEALPQVDGLWSQSYDELTLGYERQFGQTFKMGARGIARRLNDALEDAITDFETDTWEVGNPGKGNLAMTSETAALMRSLPKAQRKYYGLELTAQGSPTRGLHLVGSYVLSRVEGNYGGLFMADYGEMIPNTDPSFDIGEQVISYGLLPQDRTHAFKLAASYSTKFGLGGGVRFQWLAGTPLSVLGGSTHPPAYAFVGERGTAGRMPSIWDLNFRFSYDFGGGGWLSEARLILDIFNVGNAREAVDYDQIQYFSLDDNGRPADPNPFYGEPVRFQPPMAVRLGMEVGF
jgi:outer membrane receptor protein involved in Fe transport